MKKAFTLIEVLVALALFSVIVAIAVGGFTRALHTQHQVTLLVAAQSNASLTLEQMAREMRTGYLFCTTPSSTVINLGANPDCSASCTMGANNVATCNGFLEFYNAESQKVIYSLSNGALLRNGGQITSDNVSVKYLTFVLFGQFQGDHWNPRVTIAMGIAPSSTDPALQSDVTNLQTTVSAREPDSGSTVGY
jgi:prepilin-type N-terminal cleavage/methylation domain-containing protein